MRWEFEPDTRASGSRSRPITRHPFGNRNLAEAVIVHLNEHEA